MTIIGWFLVAVAMVSSLTILLVWLGIRGGDRPDDAVALIVAARRFSPDGWIRQVQVTVINPGTGIVLVSAGSRRMHPLRAALGIPSSVGTALDTIPGAPMRSRPRLELLGAVEPGWQRQWMFTAGERSRLPLRVTVRLDQQRSRSRLVTQTLRPTAAGDDAWSGTDTGTIPSAAARGSVAVRLRQMNNVWQNGSAWLALAIVTAGLAETKGRSRWYWFLWGILLGPLATALVVIWPRHPQVTLTPSQSDTRSASPRI